MLKVQNVPACRYVRITVIPFLRMHSALPRFGTNGISSGDGNIRKRGGMSGILKIIGVKIRKNIPCVTAQFPS